jgi:hypothetical protein
MDGEELETANWGRSSAGDALRFRSASGVGCEFAWPIIMRGDTKLCAVPFNDSLNPADRRAPAAKHAERFVRRCGILPPRASGTPGTAIVTIHQPIDKQWPMKTEDPALKSVM